MQKISKNNAIHHTQPGVDGWYYQLPEINNGTTIAYAQFNGEHGERTIGERARIYYILEGKGEFVVNGKTFPVEVGDLIPIPPFATYNLWPEEGTLKVLLYMEFFDFGNTPKK